MSNNINIVIPMSGLGSRFSKSIYDLPKPLIDIKGKPMIVRAIETLDIDGQYFFSLRNNEYTDTIKDVISKVVKDPIFIIVDKVTSGPAASVLLFEKFINNDKELITANCDQILNWDSNLFLHNARLYDGAVVTYQNNSEKNSFIKINKKGKILQFAEKQVISNISLNGIHYWKKGKYFVNSAKRMIEDNDCAPNGEYYISLSFNHMIKMGLNVGFFHIPNEQHFSVGDPHDLDIFLKTDEKI